MEDLLEELRESKTMDYDIKILISKKIELEKQNEELKKEMNEKYVSMHEKNFDATELSLVNKT
jgi:hypothetical protein